MNSYSKKMNVGVLKNLSGLAITVGNYMGLSDDGSVIIPWDLPL